MDTVLLGLVNITNSSTANSILTDGDTTTPTQANATTEAPGLLNTLNKEFNDLEPAFFWV